MARREEKARLREVRREKEVEAKRREKRLAGAYAVAGVLVIALLAGVIALAASGGNDSGGGSAGEPFGPHYEGMEERRLAAGVPTMAEGGGSHFHPLLALYANGEPITVPANIGVDPSQPPTNMVGLHTHDESGTIHNEAGTGATLGDFFAIWGVPLSPTQLGPYEAKGDKVVRMWVDGKPSQAFGDLVLKDGQQIVVSFGPKQAAPPPLSIDGA